ncbi:MAG: DNA sulfur modification protein DndD, partial [Methylococcales bacterium]
EIESQVSLTQQKEYLNKEIRELVDGSYPISLAKSFVNRSLKQLTNESKHKKTVNTAEMINEHISSLEKKIKKLLNKDEFNKINAEIKKEFGKIINPKQKTEVIHDISDGLLNTIENTINDAIETQSVKLKSLGKDLDDVKNKLDMAGMNIARAPEESLIKPIMDNIKQLQEKRASLLAKQKTRIEERKRHLRDALDVARNLDKLTANFTTSDKQDRTVNYANNSKSLLGEFAVEMAKRKISDLEGEFINSYHRLARKEDISLRAEIDPVNFSVKLVDKDGVEIDKDQLSAGEKQIYAIAILEALARTSGRKLPIIIDTPLARLDSIHRTKLIQNYFPYASHQVIILSTDTEVDEEFYTELSPSISHAYKLEFDSKTKSTSATEGYFWKTKQAEAV